MKKVFARIILKLNKETKKFEMVDDLTYWHEGPLSLAGGGGESGGGGGGGTTTTVQQADPWSGQQPYLTKAFQEAESRILNTNPAFYPNSTVVPFDPLTIEAMEMTEDRARAGSPINAAARDELTKTMRGDYLYGGPGFDAAIQAATRKALPGLDSQFAMGGRYGSGLLQEARTRAVSDAFADQYAQERTNQMRGMMFAPSVAESEYSDIGKIASVGAQREAFEAEQLAEDVARHDFAESVRQRQLQNYANLVQGHYGGTTTTTSPTPPTYSNRSAGFLGGLTGGAGLGAKLFPAVGNATPWGAIGGGLLGGVASLFGL